MESYFSILEDGKRSSTLMQLGSCERKKLRIKNELQKCMNTYRVKGRAK
jgi:hypothetical protein